MQAKLKNILFRNTKNSGFYEKQEMINGIQDSDFPGERQEFGIREKYTGRYSDSGNLLAVKSKEVGSQVISLLLSFLKVIYSFIYIVNLNNKNKMDN